MAVSTPVDIKHSGFKSLTAFLKVRAKEGLIKIKETKAGVVVTGTNKLHVIKGWFNGVVIIGVDGSHPAVQAHVRHVTVKDVEAHKEKQVQVQAQEVDKTGEQRRERQVTLLRKPGPVSAAFLRRIGKE